MAERRKLWTKHGICVTVIAPDGQSTTTDIQQPFARVGSHPKSDVVVTGPQVADLGLYFHVTAQGVYWIRLESASQTSHDLCGWMSREEPLPLGAYRLRVEPLINGVKATPDALTALNPRLDLGHSCLETKDSVRLRIQRQGNPDLTEEQVCRRPLTVIGRSHPSKIRLKRPLVSKIHCVIFWEHSALWVVDLLSANSTFVQGHRVDSARIHPGQVLRVGDIEITYAGIGGADVQEADKCSPQAIWDSKENSTSIAANQDTDIGIDAVHPADTSIETAGVVWTQSNLNPHAVPSGEIKPAAKGSPSEATAQPIPPSATACSPASSLASPLTADLENHVKLAESLKQRLRKSESARNELQKQSKEFALRDQRQIAELMQFADDQQAMRRELLEVWKHFHSHLAENIQLVDDLTGRLADAEKQRDELQQQIVTSSAREQRQEQEFARMSDELQKQSLRQLLLQEQIQSLTHVLTRQADSSKKPTAEEDEFQSRWEETSPIGNQEDLVVTPAGHGTDVLLRAVHDDSSSPGLSTRRELTVSRPSPGRFAAPAATGIVTPLEADPEGQKDLKRLVDQLLVHHSKTETSRRQRIILSVISVAILTLVGGAILYIAVKFSMDRLFGSD